MKTDEEIRELIGEHTQNICKALSLSGTDILLLELYANIIYRTAYMAGGADAIRATALNSKRNVEEAGYPHK